MIELIEQDGRKYARPDDVEAVAFGVFASGAMRGGATLERCRAMFKDLPLEDRARWLQRGRDTITYALSYVP